MTLDDAPSPGAPAVLLGPSPTAAGQRLGRDHDDAVLSGYDELEAGHDLALDSATDVEVMVVPGCEEAAARVVALLDGPVAPTVVLVADVEEHELLRELLVRHRLRVDSVLRRGTATGFVVVREGGTDLVGDDERVLRAVAELSPEPTPEPPAPRAAPAPAAARTTGGRRPTPPLVRRLHRAQPHLEGRGRTRSVAVGLGGVAVVALLVVLAATGVPGVEALLVGVLGLVAAALGVLLVVSVLHLARQVHRQTGRLESLQRQQLDALKKLEARTARTETDVRKRDELVLDFLEALAAADAVRDLELHDRLSSLLRERQARTGR